MTQATHSDGVLAKEAAEAAGAILDTELLSVWYVSARSVAVVFSMKL